MKLENIFPFNGNCAKQAKKNLNSRGVSHFLNTYISKLPHKRPFRSTTAKKHGKVTRFCSIIVVVPTNKTIPCVNTFRKFTIKTHERDTFFWDRQKNIL